MNLQFSAMTMKWTVHGWNYKRGIRQTTGRFILGIAANILCLRFGVINPRPVEWWQPFLYSLTTTKWNIVPPAQASFMYNLVLLVRTDTGGRTTAFDNNKTEKLGFQYSGRELCFAILQLVYLKRQQGGQILERVFDNQYIASRENKCSCLS